MDMVTRVQHNRGGGGLLQKKLFWLCNALLLTAEHSGYQWTCMIYVKLHVHVLLCYTSEVHPSHVFSSFDAKCSHGRHPAP